MRNGTEKMRIIGPRALSKRGGSLQVTVPPDVASYLGIGSGSRVAFMIDEQSGCVILVRSDAIEVRFSKLEKPATLGFSMSKELAKKIAAKK
jgi:bifunctional DNA-binding transcriptional regulator/antitoxin component of YhaV-PrlF toxin-antitoxin module